MNYNSHDFCYQERNQAKSIGELKEFVQKLPQMQAERQSVATRKYEAVKFYNLDL